MSKTVIISGGMLDEGFAEKVLEANPEAYIIAVDKGLEYLYNHKIEPQYIVGDFDSIDPKVIDYYRKETNIPIRELRMRRIQRLLFGWELHWEAKR